MSCSQRLRGPCLLLWPRRHSLQTHFVPVVVLGVEKDVVVSAKKDFSSAAFVTGSLLCPFCAGAKKTALTSSKSVENKTARVTAMDVKRTTAPTARNSLNPSVLDLPMMTRIRMTIEGGTITSGP